MTTDTYDAILWVSKRLFILQGYAGTSMREIAEEVGIGKATIYHHFPDKLSIISALFEKYKPNTDDSLEQIKLENDPRIQIRKSVEINMAFFQEAADIMQIIRREVPELRSTLMKEFSQYYRSYSDLFFEIVRKRIDDGIFRNMDADAVVRVLMTFMMGTFGMAVLLGEPVYSDENSVQSMLDIFLHGIEGKKAPDKT